MQNFVLVILTTDGKQEIVQRALAPQIPSSIKGKYICSYRHPNYFSKNSSDW